jgi:hypothetical protein
MGGLDMGVSCDYPQIRGGLDMGVSRDYPQIRGGLDTGFHVCTETVGIATA